MILDISNDNFKKVFDDEKFYLPIRWDGRDFSLTLGNLLNDYIRKLERLSSWNRRGGSSAYGNTDIAKVKQVCTSLKKSVEFYLNGFPSEAYNWFEKAMNILINRPLQIYQKSATQLFEKSDEARNSDDPLKLFRVVTVPDNKPYTRERIFHTPYTLRSKVATNRYSIAGYPSLYLGTSLPLCCEEVHGNPYQDFMLASVFELETVLDYSNINIEVIELGIKPQDFLERDNYTYIERKDRKVNLDLLNQEGVRPAYLLWYPLIAACSFIRNNKNDPFAAEYIIPQLLMQWVRSKISTSSEDEANDYHELMGIRYFSCASVRASDMGFNYVFPTSGKAKSPDLPYCAVLSQAFCLSNPVYLNEFDNVQSCEYYLRHLNDFDVLGN